MGTLYKAAHKNQLNLLLHSVLLGWEAAENYNTARIFSSEIFRVYVWFDDMLLANGFHERVILQVYFVPQCLTRGTCDLHLLCQRGCPAESFQCV